MFLNGFKFLIGKCLAIAMPGRCQRLLNGSIHPNSTDISRLDHYILYAVLNETSGSKLTHFHEAFWKTDHAMGWFDAFADRFSTHYLNHNSELINMMASLIKDHDLDINHVYELGTGTGDAIHYFAKHSPRDSIKYTGIDINAAQIERNKEVYSGTSVNFSAMTIQEWSQSALKESSLVFAFGGVMEYLPRQDVETLYKHIAEKAPSAIVLLETFKQGDEIEGEHSFIYGGELTLSHPHHALLKKAGFSILYERQIQQLGTDMLEIVAVKARL